MDYKLNITNIHGQIGISKNDALFSLSQPWPDLNISTRQTELNISNDLPRVIIDQHQCFSEAGLKDIFELSEEAAQRGMADSLEGIGRIVAEGNRMAMIKSKTNAFAEIAINKALPPPDEFNITLMPVSRPKIEVVGGVSFNPQMGGASINITPNYPDINFTSPSIEISMLQKPYFHFEFVGKSVDVSA